MSALPSLAMEMGVFGPFDVIAADPPWLFASNSEAEPGRQPASYRRRAEIRRTI